MSLDPDWKRIIKKAWDMRLAALAGFLSTLELILPMYAHSVPRGVFAGLSAVVITAAMVARILVQKKLTNGS